jgi:hypothetical protein
MSRDQPRPGMDHTADAGEGRSQMMRNFRCSAKKFRCLDEEIRLIPA